MKILRSLTLLTLVLLTFNALAQSKKSLNAGSTPLTQANKKIGEVKADIAKILNDKVEIYDKRNQLSGTPKDLAVMDDRIEFKIDKQNSAIYFTDFLDDSIPSANYRKTKIVLVLDKYEFITNGWVKSNFNKLEELRQNLIFIQNQTQKKRYETQLNLFEPIAAKYREMKVKPPVSEEQRKFIVQANSNNQQKMYGKAIELYKKAVEIDPTAYPGAYSNLALLSAQVNNFDAAIFYMKKYLLLEPEASDSRSARDKIYEWEGELGK